MAEINGSRKIRYLVSKLFETNFLREIPHLGFFPNNKRNNFEALFDAL